MLSSSGDAQSGSKPHPRRAPPDLSVSLARHGPVPRVEAIEGQSSTTGRFIGPLMKLPSDESCDSSEGAERWFDHANKRPGKGLGFPRTEDDEPPYFLPHNSSKDSKDTSVEAAGLVTTQMTSQPPKIQRSANGDSSAGDYRSVIDDLTIENQQLRQEIRKLKRSREAHLQKDRLFDVRIHGKLSARKRRELEDVLGSFASNIDEPAEKDATHSRRSRLSHGYATLDNSEKSAAKHSSSSNTSNSRLPDSAYASMSMSGPVSLSTPTNGPGTEGKNSSLPVKTDQSIHTFLHNIPEGLLPKHSPNLTERQKKKLVVQKLEELFTGKKGIVVGVHSQPLQQQEVSASAAKADRAANHGMPPFEGLREAHMLPYVMDADNGKPRDTIGLHGNEGSATAYTSDTSGEASPGESTPGQRPTRPLDLDPDRAQVPSENIDYIRHLGLSTPKFSPETSSDSTTATDADGWIYLNLLVSMAQLHIINVTPDFVREALLDVSEKFQVSRDGKKVRWRGGTQRTQISSDEDVDNAADQGGEDSDSLNEPTKKRRKVDGMTFAPVSVDVSNSELNHNKSLQAFRYKPLFKHVESPGSSVSLDESESHFGYNTTNEGLAKRALADPQTSRGGFRGQSTKEKQEAGLLVYYAGAKFCTDLSGDRDPSSTPVHFSKVDKDGYYSGHLDALGKSSQERNPLIERTPSGSLLPFRPFKDYSKGAHIPGLDDPCPKTPERLDEEMDEDHFVDESAGGPTRLNRQQDFDSVGIGNTVPADHFIMKVETRRTVRDVPKPGSHSKFASSAPGHGNASVPRSTLDSFFEQGLMGYITSRASLAKSAKMSAMDNLPIRTEILSLQTQQLEPSVLPPPSWYQPPAGSDSDCSESGSESGDSSRSSRSQDKGISPIYENSRTSLKHPSWAQRYPDEGFSDGDESDDEEDEEDGDGSIDMLADERRLNPEIVAAQEMEFEMGIDDKGTDAATVNESVASTRLRGLRRGPAGGVRRTSTISPDEESDEDDD